MNLTLTDEVLAQSSVERLMAVANYHHSWFLILPEDDETVGLKANAELLDVVTDAPRPYTGRAIFSVDRLAQGLPYGAAEPSSKTLTRKVYIKQITAEEIVNRFGYCGTLYFGLPAQPTKTTDLAPYFKERFGLDVAEEDIQEQTIGATQRCVIVKFAAKSLGYTGAFTADLTTALA